MWTLSISSSSPLSPGLLINVPYLENLVVTEQELVWIWPFAAMFQEGVNIFAVVSTTQGTWNTLPNAVTSAVGEPGWQRGISPMYQNHGQQGCMLTPPPHPRHFQNHYEAEQQKSQPHTQKQKPLYIVKCPLDPLLLSNFSSKSSLFCGL